MVAKDTDGLSAPSDTEARRPVAAEQLTSLGGRTPAVKSRKESAQSPEMWRSLDEYADVQSFRERIEHEFPRYAPSEWEDESSNDSSAVPSCRVVTASILRERFLSGVLKSMTRLVLK